MWFVLLWDAVLWRFVIFWDLVLAEKVWLSSPDVLIYTLGVQSWFPLCPWGVDAQEELSVGLLVDWLVFPPSVWTSVKERLVSTCRHSSAVRRMRLWLAKEPQKWSLCHSAHLHASNKDGGCIWTGEGALTHTYQQYSWHQGTEQAGVQLAAQG